MAYKRFTVSVTTDASGDGTGYTDTPVDGKIASCQYVKNGTTPYADGVDFVVSGEVSGVIVWDEDNVNASATRHVKAAAYLNTTGGAMLFAGGGTAVPADIVVAGERIKVVVASGGDTKTGTFYITVE